MAVVEVARLRKTYGPVVAVDNVTFTVEAGEIFGLVGPNGAGKTTTLECIEGLRKPDSGTVMVLGLDPQADAYALRERIGVQLQQAALPDRIRVWEALDLFSSFFSKTLERGMLLDRLGLTGLAKAQVNRLSGGQRQRLHIAMALLNDPELVFLDEITTGLDPQARRGMWDLVREIREDGKTIVLTTHFMEEAERLCHRVAVVDHGAIVAMDTPQSLIREYAPDERLSFSTDVTCPAERLRTVAGVTQVITDGDRTTVQGSGARLVNDVLEVLSTGGVRFRDLRTEQATLDDVFLALTGRQMRD